LIYSFPKICPIKKIQNQIFFFRDPEDSNGGTIIFGGSDETLYEGEMSWFNLSSATYWQISLDG
jgi:hypothetical protein